MNENLVTTGDAISKSLGFKVEETPLANWPEELGVKFYVAPEVEEIGKQLIKKFRGDLLNHNIAYVFREKAQKKAGEVVFGTAKTESELQSQFGKKTINDDEIALLCGDF